MENSQASLCLRFLEQGYLEGFLFKVLVFRALLLVFSALFVPVTWAPERI